VAKAKDGYVCIEVAVPATPTKRLEAIMQQHEGWRWIGQSRGVIYICEDQRASERAARIGRHARLLTGPGGDLRVELLETIRSRAADASERFRANRDRRA
jgi:hypothetical protein